MDKVKFRYEGCPMLHELYRRWRARLYSRSRNLVYSTIIVLLSTILCTKCTYFIYPSETIDIYNQFNSISSI